MTQEYAAWQHLCRFLGVKTSSDDPGPGDSIPWSEIVSLAVSTGLGPVLYAGTQRAGVAVPEQIRLTLRGAYYLAAARNQFRSQELAKILGSLSTAGVPVLLLKGAVLARTVYDKPALRPMADLDLLVPRHQLREVPRLLEPLGYQLRPCPPGHSFAYATQFNGEISLSKAIRAGHLLLDIHGHLVGDQWLHHATRVDMEAIWQSAQPYSYDGLAAWQLCPEDTLLHLCMHAGFSHLYNHLLHLVDIDRAVTAYDDLDWDRFLKRVLDFEVRVPVYFGLQLASELLDTPVPSEVLATLRPAALHRWVVGRAAGLERITRSDRSPSPAYRRHLAHLALIDGLPGLFRLARFSLVPGDEWLTCRYDLAGPNAIRKARFWHPFRVLARVSRKLRGRRRVERSQAPVSSVPVSPSSGGGAQGGKGQ